jgi:protein-tyrosine phosphatase
MICLLMAVQGGWALLAAWPATALALVAANYAWAGPGGFQKHDGRQSVAVRWLLAPYRLGAWINSRLWTWRKPEPDRVADTLWLGRLPTPAELARERFDAVVDVTAEFDTPRGAARSYSVPMLDLALPSLATLRHAAATLDTAVANGDRVLVCCALGYSRSALSVAAWLLQSGRCDSVDAAIARIRAARPQVVFSEAHLTLLKDLSDAH